jgi:CBS domain-containing protein
MLVRRWMTPPPAMLLTDLPAGDALRFMESRGLGHLAVLGARGFEGLVTRDRLREALAKRDLYTPRRPLELGALLEGAPLAVSPTETMENAVRLLLDRGIPALAVMEGGRLAGVLTVGDALRAFSTVLAAA